MAGRTKHTLIALATAVVVFMAYVPALSAPFQFDDVASIPENVTIRHLWPPSIPLNPPTGTTAVSGRPVVNYSLALNYAANVLVGVEQRAEVDTPYATVGYHIVNILIHLLCGALLFGVVRRTLRTARIPEALNASADRVAGALAILWLLHPIQTEAVNYVVQRTELIVSACYLGTVYASIRAWASSNARARSVWFAVGIAICLLGMGSKELMVTAPLMVILYDRAFYLTSWQALIRPPHGRRWFYLALLATVVWSITLVAAGARTGTVGFGLGLPWYRYLYSQAWAIPHYLQLVFWPSHLMIDYGQDPVGGLRGVPGLLLLGALGAATVVGWTRANKWGPVAFLGAWFFVLLAPSSSFVPITTEIAAERRIYLALIAVIAVVVLGVEMLRRQITASRESERSRIETAFATAFVAIALLLAGRTLQRSRGYAHPRILWSEVVAAQPNSARAHLGLGSALTLEHPPRLAEAEAHFRQAIALDSTDVLSWRSLAAIAIHDHRLADARGLLEHELAIRPDYADGVQRMGEVLAALDEPTQAIPFLERAAASGHAYEPLVALGNSYMSVGRSDAAAMAFTKALQIEPSVTEVMRSLADALISEDRSVEAIPYLETAATRDPLSGRGMALLGLAYAKAGRADDAVRAAIAGVRYANADPGVYMIAGQAMFKAQRRTEAEAAFTEMVRLSPTDPVAITMLGDAKALNGKRSEAGELFQRALRVKPGYGPAERGLRMLAR